MVPHGRGSNRTSDFHAHHSPVGALASFTIGRHRKHGGPGCEIGKAVEGGVFVGYRDPGQPLHLLPFFTVADSDLARYVGPQAQGAPSRKLFGADEIRREYSWATDRWLAGDVDFTVHTPVSELPDPATAPLAAQRQAFVPAITMTVTVSNPGTAERTALFAVQLPGQWLPLTGLTALEHRSGCGLATDHPRARTFTSFDPEWELNRSHGHAHFGLGGVAGFRLSVAPGTSETLTIAVGWWKPGVVTRGREMQYWYTRLFSNLADVLSHTLQAAPALRQACAAHDAELASSGLPEERQFLIAHATRGYHASTQLFNDGGRPRWVVNEGEYLMHNTFDLTVDMAFHEARFSPWALADVLDQFAREYRYESKVYDPAEPTALLPGGVAFCHDMGINNLWSPAGRSSYEIEGLDRACFSHMSCEELTNWVLTAGIYWKATADRSFLARHSGLVSECQRSLLNRDHPIAAKRRGFMQCEDERCRGGGEITTYDSLDHSLGQSRANSYLAGKLWASHLVLELFLNELGRPEEAAISSAAARLSAQTIVASVDPATGRIPSLLTDATSAPIIPAIEALAYPWYMGLTEACSETGPDGALITALKRHLQAILVEGVCLYADGGWKLSASADNSWASKIHLCQWVAERVLGLAPVARTDFAHAEWQRRGAADHGISDQFRSGVAFGSLYYPRIVTTMLWLAEAKKSQAAR